MMDALWVSLLQADDPTESKAALEQALTAVDGRYELYGDKASEASALVLRWRDLALATIYPKNRTVHMETTRLWEELHRALGAFDRSRKLGSAVGVQQNVQQVERLFADFDRYVAFREQVDRLKAEWQETFRRVGFNVSPALDRPHLHAAHDAELLRVYWEEQKAALLKQAG